MAYKRIYPVFNKSTLLLGPRGTGKSTYVKTEVKPELSIDLLKTSTFKMLLKNPSDLEDMVSHLKAHDMVFIDEIQKIPELLNEVHRLIEKLKLKFILTGSSARKLKSSGVNLLAGRAINRKFFPLTLKEIDEEKKVNDLIFSGTLPTSLNLSDKEDINDYLFSYVDTYLKEEVFQESLVRNLSRFSHFIEIAGQYHGQIINYENISRELGLSGDTIRSWFQILEDTLVGSFIEAYKLNIKPKESRHPKFYFFDAGVARAAEGQRSLEVNSEKNGFYFETLILNELKTYIEVLNKDYKIFYYNVPGQSDVDFIIETQKKTLSKPSQFVLINIKFGKTWSTAFNKLPNEIQSICGARCKKIIGIYQGSHILTKDNSEIYPVLEFVKNLWSGKLF